MGWQNIRITQERVGDGGAGVFYLAQAARALELAFAEGMAGKVRMVYLDPPFFTGQRFYYRQRVGIPGWQGEAAYTRPMPIYTDKFAGGLAGYLEMLRAAFIGARELLMPGGCIYVHVDWRASAHVRLLLDEIFGAKNFLNEIIWQYKSGGRAQNHFSRKHDTIFFYCKDKPYYFNPLAVAGKRGPQRRNHMKRQVDADGRVFYSIRSAGKVYTYYEDAPLYLDDVWNDIPHLQQMDPERTGYDTQKPQALLERIIRASSQEGEIVADLFSGSGTLAAAALACSRRFLAADASPYALCALRRRIGEAPCRLVYDSVQDAEPFQGAVHDRVAALGPMPDAGLSVGAQGSLLPDPAEVDAWAAGRVEGGVFQVGSRSVRTLSSPALEPLLPFGEGPGRRAVLLADLEGAMRAYAWEEERGG